MGSYGIGVSRILETVLIKNNGLWWNPKFTNFRCVLLGNTSMVQDLKKDLFSLGFSSLHYPDLSKKQSYDIWAKYYQGLPVLWFDERDRLTSQNFYGGSKLIWDSSKSLISKLKAYVYSS
jgi:hypothetical protein